MKFVIILLLIASLWMACKELGDTIYEPPLINSLTLTPDGTILPGDSVKAIVKASNPEKGSLTYQWEAPDGGTFLPPADLDSIIWIAPFQGGEYRIRAIVSNDKESRETNRIDVQSLDKPLVKILSPANQQSFIVGQEMTINAEAYHDNDLSRVVLLLNNMPADTLGSYSSHNYLFHFTADTSSVGPLEIKVLAEVLNQPTNTNFDYVTVYIQGVIQKAGVSN